MQMNLDNRASAATTANSPISISTAAATVSSSTLAAATLTIGKQSILPLHRLCSLHFGKSVQEDFLEFTAGKVATGE